MINTTKLLDKCEAMTLLCTKASTYWSFVKFCFTMPLVLTSSAMCIINSISDDATLMRIPNIVVNAVNVLVLSLNNNIKSSEKFDTFKKLSQQFMELSQELEYIDDNISKDKYDIIVLKYDNLIKECAFEDIPSKYKLQVAKLYTENNRYIPIHLNGIIGNLSYNKRNSRDGIVLSNNNIV